MSVGLNSLGRPVQSKQPSECSRTVCAMPSDPNARTCAYKAGLKITAISWEDNARTKNSSWGPCISDMTLSVDGFDMPLIRSTSNFKDETWDVEIEKIPLVVGNEDDSMLRTVTLKEYLGNLRDYLHTPSKWPGSKKSLLIPGEDKHVICSAQACFLPVPAEGDAKFNVAIRNYQSRPKDPAILAIVASANGTSARVLDSSCKVPLYHNNKGQRASYVGQRLSDFRRETGSEQTSDAPMTASEKSQNMLLVIQVPLKQKKVISGGGAPTKPGRMMLPKASCSPSPSVDVESAIISVGADEGAFAEIRNCEMERDVRFPIRVTMQYYKATSNGEVNEAVMHEIASELQGARKWAVAISSLVTETTDRTTEHKATLPTSVSVTIAPSWWNAFWNEYATIYGSWSANAAHDALFVKGRFSTSKLDDVRDEILEVLGRGPTAAPVLPQWEVV